MCFNITDPDSSIRGLQSSVCEAVSAQVFRTAFSEELVEENIHGILVAAIPVNV